MAASWGHSDLMIIVSNACTEEGFGSPPTWVADTSCHVTPSASETSRKRLRYSNYENLVEICQRGSVFHAAPFINTFAAYAAASEHRLPYRSLNRLRLASQCGLFRHYFRTTERQSMPCSESRTARKSITLKFHRKSFFINKLI